MNDNRKPLEQNTGWIAVHVLLGGGLAFIYMTLVPLGLPWLWLPVLVFLPAILSGAQVLATGNALKPHRQRWVASSTFNGAAGGAIAFVAIQIEETLGLGPGGFLTFFGVLGYGYLISRGQADILSELAGYPVPWRRQVASMTVVMGAAMALIPGLIAAASDGAFGASHRAGYIIGVALIGGLMAIGMRSQSTGKRSRTQPETETKDAE